MEIFIRRPDIDMYGGIKVTRDTELTYENENVKQTLKDLEFHSITTVKGENYTSTYDTTITLQEGDILVFEEEGRGYIKPVERFVTIEEAIQDLEAIRGIGGE